MRFLFGLAIGIAVGVAAYWIYANREALGFVVNHRDSLSTGSKLLSDAKEFWGTL